MNTGILEVKNLTKQFGNFTAVDNISFSLKQGEILGLLGPNGAGKTTTIQMLLGVMTPTSGDIIYFGKEFAKHREYILKQVNFASTYISLPYLFTVKEILDIFARLYEIPNKKERIEKLIIAFDLQDLQKSTYAQLSAGEKTRLVMTKAFLNYPKIILLDEPTASLDPEIAQKVREFLLKEKHEYNTSILLTSHNMTEVEDMCDRVIVLNHGKIIDEGTPEKLTKNITTCEIELKIRQDKNKAQTFFKEKALPFEEVNNRFMLPMDEKHIAEFLTLLANENIAYEEISINKPNLEDYFLQVIKL